MSRNRISCVGVTAIAVVLAMSVAESHGQAPGGRSDAPAAVTGTALDARTGAEIRSASVQLTSADGQFDRVSVTSNNGRFVFAEVPPGRFRLSATKAGYLKAHVGQTHFEDPEGVVELIAGRPVEPVVLWMWPAAAIAGVVRDPGGEPLADVEIQALRVSYDAGEQRLSLAASVPRADVRGAFRIGGLSPGYYHVVARPRYVPQASHDGSGTLSLGSTYYPGATALANAQALRIHSGETATLTIDMAQAWLATVRGVALDSRGQALRGESVTVGELIGTRVVPVTHAVVSAQGTFSVEGLWPGQYVLRMNARESQEVAGLTIPVTGDTSGITLTSQPLLEISGRIVGEGLPLRLPGLRVVVAPIDGGTGWGAQVQDDRSFALRSPWGPLRVSVSDLPPELAVGSMTVNGSRLRHGLVQLKPGGTYRLEVLVVPARAEISGVATGIRADESGRGSVVLFPVDRATRERPFVRTVSPAPDGTFAIGNLPEGDYYIAAVSGVGADLVTAPETLRQVESGATAIHVANDARRTVELRAVTP